MATKDPMRDQQVVTMIHNLTNHPPRHDSIVHRFETLRSHAKDLGSAIIALTPASREQSLALTNLEQTVMWAVAAIARNQDAIVPSGSLEDDQ